MRHSPRGAGLGHLIDRRTFLGAVVTLLGSSGLRAELAGETLPADLATALPNSEFAYISPLRADGTESRCHGEVWYAWLAESAVIITGRESWKARSLAAGRDRARIWVGNHGRWKGRLGGRNQAFRKAPSFEARASVSKNGALLDALLGEFDRKYPAEIARWRDRMRKGFADGTRRLIRYAPD